MTLCYYITGHGFGHAIRAAQVMNALPPDVRLLVKTTAAERVFREELAGRPFDYFNVEYDCGCLQSDSVTVLPRATLDRYAEIARRNERILSEEIAFLKREGVSAVVTDAPSFPLRVASEAGIPGFIITNFTWHDIYREYKETEADQALLDTMAREYASATLALITDLAVPTIAALFPHSERIPLVARHGRNIRAALAQATGAKGSLALLYLGGWGLELNWAALAAFSDWTFLTYDPPPFPVANVRVLTSEWPYADVAASVNAVVTKPGYGTITECIANSVPLIYLPRTLFAEYNALVAGMNAWGGGVLLLDADYRAGRWGNALNAAQNATLSPNVYETNGAQVAAEKIVRLLY